MSQTYNIKRIDQLDVMVQLPKVMRNFNIFSEKYKQNLHYAMEKNPDLYGVSPENLEDQHNMLSQKMLNTIKCKGIGAVNIDSLSFNRTAKEIGIKNTYKAWREFLKNNRRKML